MTTRVYVPADLRRKLDILAAARGVSGSALGATAIIEWLAHPNQAAVIEAVDKALGDTKDGAS